MKPTVGSLFAGIGGFDLGFERAGFDVTWQVEIDPWCRKVLAKHFPNAERFEDVRECGSHNLKPVDVICGGFPCQDISNAGLRAGIEGERSGLWSEYARIIGELRPKFAVVENVSALLERGLSRVVGDLAEIGYDAEWEILSAADVGAPHRRDRIWIIAYPNSFGCNYGQHYRKGRYLLHDADWDAKEDQQEGHRWISRFSKISEDVADTRYPRIYERGFCSETCEDDGFLRRIQSNGVSCESEEKEKSLADTASIGQSGQRKFSEWSSPSADGKGKADIALAERFRDFWAVEPDVGGGFDGLSVWLDGFSGLNESHKLLFTYANEVGRPGEILSALRSSIEEKILRWETGGSRGIIAEKVLLAYLCKLQAGCADDARIQLEGEKALEAILRGMRGNYQPSGASCRPEQSQQFAREHSNALQVLSRLLALHAEKAWMAYRRSDACPEIGWESGIARVMDGVPKRVNRLRGLGNAVVPQIPELYALRISEMLKRGFS